ncbi:tetratricopeptide repeat protein, partial [Bacillus cereus]|nr:tetratricopeptide repeat protein [Bacillus cereus]
GLGDVYKRQELISYQPKKKEVEQMPAAAAPLPEPEELRTNEELYLAGQHLEQYRHATFEPEAYYLEGLKRDKNDSRINVAYGTLLLRRGLYSESEECFRKAISRVTWRNSNPYDGEAYYQLGLSLKYQERMDEAFAAFYKSVWSAAWQDSGYFSLAQIATEKGNYEEALELVERSIIRNARNYKARNLKSAILRKLGSYEAAIAYSKETIKLDIADFVAYREQALSLEALGLRDDAKTVFEELEKWMRGDVHNYIAVASDYAAAGLYEDAVCVLEEAPEQAKTYPMLYYVQAFCYAKIGKYEQANNALAQAAVAVPDYCFPNSLLELDVLQFAIRTRPGDGKAHYYLGNLLYDKKRHWDAISSWETSRSIDDTYP